MMGEAGGANCFLSWRCAVCHTCHGQKMFIPLVYTECFNVVLSAVVCVVLGVSPAHKF